MKKLFCTAIAAMLAAFAFSQSVFPTDGSNVGIGTTAPQAKLDVNGDMGISNILKIGKTSASPNAGNKLLLNQGAVLQDQAGSYQYPFEIQQYATGNMARFQIASYRRAAGQTWPGTGFRLQYGVDNSFTDGSKSFIEIGTGGPANTGGGFISLSTEGTDRLVVNSLGNIGIGTTNPQAMLDVSGNGHFSGEAFSNGGFRVNSGTGDNVNNAPWYGVGQTGLVLGTSPQPAVQLAGFWGLNMQTGGGRMVIDQNGKVGIGTTAPRADLDNAGFGADGATRNVFARMGEGDASGDGTYLGVRAFGTQNNYNGKSFSIENHFYGDKNCAINFYRGGNTMGGFLTFETNKGTEQMRLTSQGNLLLGKTAQVNTAYMLDVAGNVRANKLVVNTTGADFVFSSSYKLKPLDEVENYVKQNRHLPGIASATKMQREGVDVGVQQTKLLQKVEELFLYAMAQDKKICRDQVEINDQRLLIAEQGKLLLRLQKNLDRLELVTKEPMAVSTKQ